MSLSLERSRRWTSSNVHRSGSLRRHRCFPAVEWLENYVLLSPTIYTVTNTADSGPGSLRYGINSARDNGFWEIDFNIPTTTDGKGNLVPVVINVGSGSSGTALPHPNNQIIINGFTEGINNGKPNYSARRWL